MHNIIVKFDLEAIHWWDEAPDKLRDFRVPHGHIFHFECYIPVNHSDRALELLTVRSELLDAVKDDTVLVSPHPIRYSFGVKSCEAIAQWLASLIEHMYGVEPVRVVVMEDLFVGGEWLSEEVKHESRLVR